MCKVIAFWAKNQMYGGENQHFTHNFAHFKKKVTHFVFFNSNHAQSKTQF